jgi:hypothetical protein
MRRRRWYINDKGSDKQRHRIILIRTCRGNTFLNFSYVCPEPVLAKNGRVSVQNGIAKEQNGFVLTVCEASDC